MQTNKSNTSIKECLNNFKSLIKKDPPLLKKAKEKLEAENGIDNHKNLNYESIKHQIDTFIHNNEKLVFLLGPWGSGKTYLMEKYSHEIQEDSLYFIKKSFFSISSLNEAYIHLIGYFKTLIFLVVIYIIFYRFEIFKSTFLSPLFIVFSLMLITNKMNITYSLYKLTSALVDILITSGFHLAILTRKVLDMRDLKNYKHKVYILDDLDRSSLKQQDRWALLANLWFYNTTYIVLLGYSNDELIQDKSKFEIIELCEKLEGKIIFLPTPWERNEEIMNQYLSQNFENYKFISPFQKPSWLTCFTPRELINIVDHFKLKFEEFQLRKRGYEFVDSKFFDCLLIRFIIEKYIEKKCIPSDAKNFLCLPVNSIELSNQDCNKFYNSLFQFISEKIIPTLSKINDISSPQLKNYKNKSNEEFLKIIFLNKENEMLTFFDATAQLWMNTNEKNEIS